MGPAPRGASHRALLEWEAPEYHTQQKTTLWYAGFGVIMALLLFAAFLMRSFLSGVVFALLGLLILLYSERPPRTVRFRILTDALAIGDRRYPANDLEVFNIVDGPPPSPDAEEPSKLLLVRSRRLVLPLLHLPLGDTDPEAVRHVLRGALREDPELRESFADILAHWVGF